MQLRIVTEPQQGASYEDILKTARLSEDFGYDAFFRSDHYLKLGNVSGLPGPTDAWTTIAGLARDTSRIRLGTLVSPATFRHPSVLAISVSQIDHMSGGRVELGLGAGWFADEHRAYGIPFPETSERFELFEEQLKIISGLWRTPMDKSFNFEGKNYKIVDSPALPKPLQHPYPPIVLGGMGKRRGLYLAALFANEYNLFLVDPATAVDRFRRLDDMAIELCREPGDIAHSLVVIPAIGRSRLEISERINAIARVLPAVADSPRLPEYVLAGSVNEVVDLLGKYTYDALASRIYLEMLDVNDVRQIELFASEVAPQILRPQ